VFFSRLFLRNSTLPKPRDVGDFSTFYPAPLLSLGCTYARVRKIKKSYFGNRSCKPFSTVGEKHALRPRPASANVLPSFISATPINDPCVLQSVVSAKHHASETPGCWRFFHILPRPPVELRLHLSSRTSNQKKLFRE